MFSRRWTRRAVLGLSLATAGCELEKIQLPLRRGELVIHAVLVPTGTFQDVLVERTQTGEVPTPQILESFGEPIADDGGIIERFGSAELTTPSGQVITVPELETISSNHHGGGIYRFNVAGSALVPGGRYKLRFVSRDNEVLLAETVMPAVPVASTPGAASFNRVTDTATVTWSAVPNARGYQVRVEGPYGPWVTYTESTHVKLHGGLRSIVDPLPRVFIPGFRQTLSIVAVDTNVYDYYRSATNPFTGTGLISHVRGGYGVFGAQSLVHRQTLNVTAPFREPTEGNFTLSSDPVSGLYGGFADAQGITLYIESAATQNGQKDALSGSYRTTGGFVAGIVGTRLGNDINIAFLRSQILSDTVEHWRGSLHGDTLVGRFSGNANGRYLRVP